MISLEQVQLLEEKVAKAIEYVERLTLENTELSSNNLDLELKSNALELENKKLLTENKTLADEKIKLKDENLRLADEKKSLVLKMEANQKRIDELEVHVLRFKEDQSRIEDGIIAALDRLSQFEEAFETSLKDTKPKAMKKSNNEKPQDDKEIFFEIPGKEGSEEDEQIDEEEASLESELDIF